MLENQLCLAAGHHLHVSTACSQFGRSPDNGFDIVQG